ncbi:MAG: BrnT family toxin [Acidobacteriia bacterium]|nr:BrnT family toxin [Terriglobia bacterium]
MAGGIEFDWDAGNTKHLVAHRVTVREFESVMQNSPLDLAYEVVDGEERYRSVGMTDRGRLLVAIWTLRNGRVRAVTAFPASATYKKLFPTRKR